jgi:hypothetical protein
VTDRGEWNEAVAAEAARFIPRGSRVLDLGETVPPVPLPFGAERLTGRLDGAAPLPDGFDLVLALGGLGAPETAAEALAALRRLDRPVVVALPPPGADSPDRALTREALLRLAAEAGFARGRLGEAAGGLVMRLEPVAPAYRLEREVWILSYSNIGNFGDRLGQHLASHVLPPNARVTRLNHEPWNAPATGGPDLLIVGLGNSLFQPLLTDDLLALMGRARACVGIFGTQYREAIAPGRLAAVLDRLDAWWARNEADLFLYGRGRTNARHLGDWLIDAFPLARPSRDEALELGDEIWEDQPLDRTIERIQAYTRVASRRLHPLLCALTSARQVAYAEQRALSPEGLPSGKFRSMLLDVFGQDRPEGEFWDVDPTAVADYKVKVRRNVAALRESLTALLA